MSKGGGLSDQGRRILELIGSGHGYEQILKVENRLTYLDIFAAAREALDVADGAGAFDPKMVEVKRRYPRAYERWSEAEDAELWERHLDGIGVEEIASSLRRQPSAIRSRLEKHRLMRQAMGWRDDDSSEWDET